MLLWRYLEAGVADWMMWNVFSGTQCERNGTKCCVVHRLSNTLKHFHDSSVEKIFSSSGYTVNGRNPSPIDIRIIIYISLSHELFTS